MNGRDLAPAAAPRPSCLRTLFAAAATLGGLAYILNPTAGIDLLPDNLPGVGNLDEAGATALLLWGLRELFRRRRPN